MCPVQTCPLATNPGDHARTFTRVLTVVSDYFCRKRRRSQGDNQIQSLAAAGFSGGFLKRLQSQGTLAESLDVVKLLVELVEVPLHPACPWLPGRVKKSPIAAKISEPAE